MIVWRLVRTIAMVAALVLPFQTIQAGWLSDLFGPKIQISYQLFGEELYFCVFTVQNMGKSAIKITKININKQVDIPLKEPLTLDAGEIYHFNYDPYGNPQPRNCTIETDQGDVDFELSIDEWPTVATILELQRDAAAQAHPHKPHPAVPGPTPTPVPEVPSPSPTPESTPNVSNVSRVPTNGQPPAPLNPEIQAIGEFMKSYFDAVNSGDVDALVAKYEEHVDFLDFGILTRDQVRAKLTSWYHEFPKHHLTLTDRIHMTQGADGSLDLTYPTHSRIEAADGKWSEADYVNTMSLQVIGGSFFITKRKVLSSSNFVEGG